MNIPAGVESTISGNVVSVKAVSYTHLLTRAVKRQFFRGRRIDLKIDIQEVKHFEENALLVAEQVAEQLERRLPFRRVLKGTLDQVEKNRSIRGVKIEISGRLGGAEMSRREWLSRGTLPLHTPVSYTHLDVYKRQLPKR